MDTSNFIPNSIPDRYDPFQSLSYQLLNRQQQPPHHFCSTAIICAYLSDPTLAPADLSASREKMQYFTQHFYAAVDRVNASITLNQSIIERSSILKRSTEVARCLASQIRVLKVASSSIENTDLTLLIESLQEVKTKITKIPESIEQPIYYKQEVLDSTAIPENISADLHSQEELFLVLNIEYSNILNSVEHPTNVALEEQSEEPQIKSIDIVTVIGLLSGYLTISDHLPDFNATFFSWLIMISQFFIM